MARTAASKLREAVQQGGAGEVSGRHVGVRLLVVRSDRQVRGEYAPGMSAHHGLARRVDVHAGVKDAECEMSAQVHTRVGEMLSESVEYKQCEAAKLRVPPNDDPLGLLAMSANHGLEEGCG
jgi:hypothetical protein